MDKLITEYTITFEDIDEEDFITEDKQEADAKIEELKDNGEFYKVYQYYAKDWVYNDETGDWEESDVEVYYTKGEDEELEESSEIPMYIDEYYPTRQEAKAAEKVLKQQGRKTKVERHGNEYIVWTSYEKVEEDINQEDKIEYNIYTISGGDGVYNSHKVDTVETEEQAIDRVSELEAEMGSGAYYTKVVNGKELEEAKSSNNKYEIEYVVPNYTGGNVYVFTGKLKDGNYFIADDTYFGKEGDTFSPFDVTIVDTDPDKVYTDEDGYEYTLLDDIYYQEQHFVEDIEEDDAKEFTKMILQWVIDNKPEGNYQIGEMEEYLYIATGTDKVEEAKSSNNKYEIEYVTPNYTGGNVYVFTGKLKDGNYFIADDGYFTADDTGNVPGFDVRIVNMDPDKVLETDSDGLSFTLVDDAELQDEHLVKDLDENEEIPFTLDLLNWIIKNEPEGNYNIGELQDELNVLKKSIQRNNKSINENKDLTEAVDNVNVNETIRNLTSQINEWFENNKIDKLVLYEETPYYGIVTTNVLDKDLYDKYGTTAYETEDEQVFNQDGFGYEVIKYLENYLKTLKNKKVTEAIDIKDNEFKVGDKVKIDYISDGNKYNDEVGTIKWIHKYKYYPNGKENEFEYKYQAEIEYSDGGVLAVNDIYAPGSGIVGTIKKVTEALDDTQKQEDEKEETEQQEEIIDTENELEEGIKKEVYQYAKQQGLDIEKLRKQGIELETLEETLDTVIGNMVSKSAIEYMDKTGKDITWDFEVSGNDIKIIWNEV